MRHTHYPIIIQIFSWTLLLAADMMQLECIHTCLSIYLLLVQSSTKPVTFPDHQLCDVTLKSTLKFWFMGRINSSGCPSSGLRTRNWQPPENISTRAGLLNGESPLSLGELTPTHPSNSRGKRENLASFGSPG